MSRKPHIHVMAICHTHGPMVVEVLDDLDAFEKYLDGLTDILMKVDDDDDVEVEVHNRAQYSLEFHKKSTLNGEKHEFIVTYSYCPRIIQNCRLRMDLDKMDAMDEEAPGIKTSGMVVTMGPDGVANVEMVGDDPSEVPAEIRAVIEQIAGIISAAGIGKRETPPDMETLMGSEREAINKRFNDLFR